MLMKLHSSKCLKYDKPLIEKSSMDLYHESYRRILILAHQVNSVTARILFFKSKTSKIFLVTFKDSFKNVSNDYPLH